MFIYKIKNLDLKIKNGGFSLIESVIYIGLLAIIISMAAYFISNISNAFNRTFAQKEVLENIQNALDTVTEEIKFSRNIYTPTGVFDQDNGQLSIETNQNPPNGETAAFVDFYLDNGRIYIKKEGQTETPLTSNQVKINKLKFIYLNPPSASDGVQIQIEGQYNTQNADLANQTKINLTTSAIIRYR